MTDESTSGTLRVLVVDDGRLVRETTLRQLREAGFPAEAVDNGYRALDQLDGGDWDDSRSGSLGVASARKYRFLNA